MNPDKLKAFLIDLPGDLGFRHSKAVKHYVFKALYYSCTDEGKFLSQLFPKITQSEIDDLDDYKFVIDDDSDGDTLENKAFYNVKGSPLNYSHPPDKTCAKPLGKGDVVYRCSDCGLDETCVICEYCFNREEHRGHDVQVYTSAGNGGLCDCGDPEAFNHRLECKCQQDIKDDTNIDSKSIYQTIQICLDYILDVTNFSISTLPIVHDFFKKSNRQLSIEQLSNYSFLPSGHYGGAKDINSHDLWYLILWNDEYHDYVQAKDAIKNVTKMSDDQAELTATYINDIGKAILKEASSYQELLDYQTLAEVNGLVCTITSARDYMRDEIVISMFSWLKDILDFQNHSWFKEVCKNHLIKLLLEPNYHLSKTVPAEFLMIITDGNIQKCFENGLLFDNKIVNLGLSDLNPHFKIDDMKQSSRSILIPNKILNDLQYSRLQLLLLFEIRLSKIVREMLPLITVMPIVSDLKLKAILTTQLANIYPSLITAEALTDREEKLNILSEFTSQLFTCPASIQSMIKNDQFRIIIGSLIALIEDNSSGWNNTIQQPNFVLNDFRRSQEYQRVIAAINRGIRDVSFFSDINFGISPESQKIIEAIDRGIRDVSYFLDTNFASNELKSLISKDNLILILLLLRLFQGHSPMERKYGDHVEHEVADYLALVNYSFPILKISRSLGTVKADPATIQNAVNLILEYLHLQEFEIDSEQLGTIKFQVSLNPVAFVNPINSLLSYLIQSNDFSLFENILKSQKKPFINIADVSLRSLVLGAQIRIGAWVRNGVSASRQAALYFSPVLYDFTYFRDIHLIQIAAICDDPTMVLNNLISRWELMDWFMNKCNFGETVYEERFFSIAERFILFLYQLFVDRSFFLNLTPTAIIESNARKEISYALYEGPKPYSKLKSSVGSEVSLYHDFDKILLEIANYTPPSALVDSGTYRLKQEVLEKLDPMSLYLDASDFLTVHNSIVKCISERKKIPEDKVVVKAAIKKCDIKYVDDNIASFTKTMGFAKLICKLLQVAIDNADETYLLQLLHLIDAILVDDELHNGPHYMHQEFVKIPICDLLLTIVESTLSKHIVTKADYLVERFISKDNNIVENLVECFGEDYMNDYKKRKTSLFESESERVKRRAAERKMRVMKKFANQRQAFLKQNKDFETDSDTSNFKSDEEKNCAYSNSTCVLCGEAEDQNNQIGILVSVITSSTFWKIPTGACERVSKAFNLWEQERIFKDEFGLGYKYSKDTSNVKAPKSERLVLSTCGHSIHYKCYKQSAGSARRYPCPLCRNLHDFFLPTYIPASSGGSLDELYLNRDPIGVRHNDISFATNEVKCSTIVNSLIHEDYLNPETHDIETNCIILNDLIRLTNSVRYLPTSSDSERYLNYLLNTTLVLSDSIIMIEISTRLENENNFLEKIPGSMKTLLKALIHNRALLYEFRKEVPLLQTSNNLSVEIKKFWSSDKWIGGIFQEIIQLFFQTDESLATLARFGLAKLVAVTLYSLIHRIKESSKYLSFMMKPWNKQAFKITAPKEFRVLVLNVISNVNSQTDCFIDQNDELIDSLYYNLSKMVQVYLRHMIIFKDLLTARDEGDNTHCSTTLLSSLPIVKEENFSETIDIYTKVMNIPNLNDIISILANREHCFDENIFFITLSSKIHKYLDSGILLLEYPGVVRLIDLPIDYKDSIASVEGYAYSSTHDFLVCLHCGSKTKVRKGYFPGAGSPHPGHMQTCSKRTGIFFNPISNVIRLCIYIGQDAVVHEIAGPYLTVHGEAKNSKRKGIATLNKFRYSALNKMWLDQSLYGFVTRAKFGGLHGNFGFDGLELGDDSELDEDNTDEEDNFLVEV